MDKFFKISERGSNVRTEIVGGIVTFFSMAYIIFVNPNYLSAAGMNWHAVMLATCISAAIGCFLTAMLANVPFAQAPGMGLNAFFTYTLCFGMGYTWQQGLAIVLVSGLLFLAVTLSPLRSKIIASIPADLKAAISAGIGLFITFIGMLNADIVKLIGDTVEDGVVVATDYSDMGNILHGPALLALIGLLIISVLLAYKVKGAIFIGIIVTTIIGVPMGLTVYNPDPVSFSVLGETFGKLSFSGIFAVDGGVLAFITAVITFFICDCFDTVGTLIGTARSAGMLDRRGNLPGGDRALIADAVATCTGAIFGTSTVTTFVESSTGIAEGARTGLSSLVVGALFLLSCFFAPIAGIVPSAALLSMNTPTMIRAGAVAAEIAWDDMEIAIPCFLTIVTMPFAYSIGDGIGFGFISYSLIKLARGKAKEVPVLIYVLSVAFAAMFLLTYL